MTTPKFCSNCGTSLSSGAKFCADCGTPVPTAAEPAAAEPTAAANEEPANEPKADAPAAPDLSAAPAEAAPAKKPAPAAATAADGSYKDPVASLLAGGDDDDDDDDLSDHLDLPGGTSDGGKKSLPLGLIAMLGLVAVLVGGGVFISSDDELNARFRCNIMGEKSACITEEDRLWEIEQQEKKEEMELMTHHYGAFDLSFTPETDASFTLVQKRYEEGRKDFVKRIREGAADKRTFKEKKIGVYSTGKSVEGVIKGQIKFSKNAPSDVTFKPEEGKALVLPLSLADLPLLEREQADGNGKRLTAEDIEKLEKERDTKGADAKKDPRFKVKTQALSTWIYEIHISAKGFKPRSVVFYEAPLAPGIDRKKMETEGNVTFRAFKRRPDGKFVIENASFDLLPEPRTLWTRYIQGLKEVHCLQKTKAYKARDEQGQKDAEALLWEQKAFNKVLMEIAHQNDEDPEWIKYKEEQFKGYKCPEMVGQ
ncbi:MAG: zinc ribbon domain-containing protein [Myxococcales bacterium]|nr:zinc ribbon domain-containing protein [Myxococcales bacterium]